jgi:Tol biopolymer transport system component
MTRRMIVLLAAIGLMTTTGAGAQAAVPATTQVNVATGGAPANAVPSSNISVSTSGRYVAFVSTADNLVAGDGNGVSDVFLRDRVAATTERISVSSAEVEGNASSAGAVAVSGDGRYVVFESVATNLAPGTGGESGDILIRDRTAGTTSLVKSFGGLLSDQPAAGLAVSDNGQFVAFDAFLTLHQVFVVRRNRATGTERIVNPENRVEADDRLVGISADGSRVAVTTDLGAGVWVHDFLLNRNLRADVNDSLKPGNGRSIGNALSADGRYVLFASRATNLVNGDTNGKLDAFVHDVAFDHTVRVSISNGERQALGGSRGLGISGHGRFALFLSFASNLVAGDTNGVPDVFVRDRRSGTTVRCSVSSAGVPADRGSVGGSLSRNGLWAIFLSPATNLAAGDTNGAIDLFERGPGC